MDFEISLNELMLVNKLIYKPNHLCLDKLESEKEHSDYGAFTYTLNKKPVKFRIAKITPIKIGCFVALWKRDTAGNNVPYDGEDHFSFYIIHVVKKIGAVNLYFLNMHCSKTRSSASMAKAESLAFGFIPVGIAQRARKL
jgi:hypothetical protein